MHGLCAAAGPSTWLLAYRLLAFVYTLTIAVTQALRIGARIFVFFTTWNWALLTIYFGVSTLASLRAWSGWQRQGGRPGKKAGILGKAVVVLYHIEAPVGECRMPECEATPPVEAAVSNVGI